MSDWLQQLRQLGEKAQHHAGFDQDLRQLWEPMVAVIEAADHQRRHFGSTDMLDLAFAHLERAVTEATT